MSGGSDESLDEPRRLADSGASPSSQMIRAVRQVDASPAAKRRLLRRASWLSLVSLSSSYAADAAAALSGKSIALLTGLSVAAGVATYALRTPSPSPFPLAPPSAVQEAPVFSTPLPVSAPTEVSVEQPQGPEPEPAEVVAPKAGPPRKAIDRLLSEEIRLFDSARAAVRNARPGEALSRLDQYGERFPNGRLSLEASALRIEALAASGKRAQARTLAQRFIERHPKSLLVERVRPYAAEP